MDTKEDSFYWKTLSEITNIFDKEPSLTACYNKINEYINEDSFRDFQTKFLMMQKGILLLIFQDEVLYLPEEKDLGELDFLSLIYSPKYRRNEWVEDNQKKAKDAIYAVKRTKGKSLTDKLEFLKYFSKGSPAYESLTEFEKNNNVVRVSSGEHLASLTEWVIRLAHQKEPHIDRLIDYFIQDTPETNIILESKDIRNYHCDVELFCDEDGSPIRTGRGFLEKIGIINEDGDTQKDRFDSMTGWWLEKNEFHEQNGLNNDWRKAIEFMIKNTNYYERLESFEDRYRSYLPGDFRYFQDNPDVLLNTIFFPILSGITNGEKNYTSFFIGTFLEKKEEEKALEKRLSMTKNFMKNILSQQVVFLYEKRLTKYIKARESASAISEVSQKYMHTIKNNIETITILASKLYKANDLKQEHKAKADDIKTCSKFLHDDAQKSYVSVMGIPPNRINEYVSTERKDLMEMIVEAFHLSAKFANRERSATDEIPYGYSEEDDMKKYGMVLLLLWDSHLKFEVFEEKCRNDSFELLGLTNAQKDKIIKSILPSGTFSEYTGDASLTTYPKSLFGAFNDVIANSITHGGRRLICGIYCKYLIIKIVEKNDDSLKLIFTNELNKRKNDLDEGMGIPTLKMYFEKIGGSFSPPPKNVFSDQIFYEVELEFTRNQFVGWDFKKGEPR